MVGGALMQNCDEVIRLHYPLYTKEEIFELLSKSRKQIENGEGQNMQDALDEIEEELGL